MAVSQRLQQGIRALFAFTRPVDHTLAAAYLNPAQMAYFRQMKRSEQQHSLNVLRALLAQGSTPDDLAVAALLHDVGKIRQPLAVWQKAAVVLARRFLPRAYARWSADDATAPRWRRMFIVAAHHPRWGAALIAPTGAAACVIWLIAHHADDPALWEDHPCIQLLKRLKLADDTH